MQDRRRRHHQQCPSSFVPLYIQDHNYRFLVLKFLHSTRHLGHSGGQAKCIHSSVCDMWPMMSQSRLESRDSRVETRDSRLSRVSDRHQSAVDREQQDFSSLFILCVHPWQWQVGNLAPCRTSLIMTSKAPTELLSSNLLPPPSTSRTPIA